MKQTNKPAAKLSQTGIAVALAFLAAATAQADQRITKPVIDTDQLIVKYRNSGLSAQQLNSPSADTAIATMQAQRMSQVQGALQQFGAIGTLKRTTGLGSQVIKLDKRRSLAEVAAMAAKIAKDDPNVEYAEPDRIKLPLAAAPNDTNWSKQWDLQNSSIGINVPNAWDLSTGSGVNVAVIDTGYRPHADLAANILPGYDMINDTAVAVDGNARDSDASDPGDWQAQGECPAPNNGAHNSSWHGTHVAGTIAAVTNNGVGVAGIAPNAKIVPVRVLGKCGGYDSDIADAMIWASGGTVAGLPANPNKARVLNLSLGGSGPCDSTSQAAINTARANGAVVVIAAGNDSMDVSDASPANCSGVVAVAAYDKTGGRSYYSNFGNLITLAAPGGAQSGANDPNGILSTLNSGTKGPGSDNYIYYQGTSMAAPHVAGVAALMLAAKPSATPDEVIAALKSSARPFVASCQGCGAGMLDAYGAVKAIKGDIIDPPATGETESNNTLATANAVTAPKTLSATMGSSTDVDYFSVQLPAGRTLQAVMTPNASSDYDLYVYNSAGSQIGSSENGKGSADTVSVTNTGSSTLTRYVKVVYYSGGTGSTNGKYSLKLSW
nr:peptidase S8A [uncultured bacterium]